MTEWKNITQIWNSYLFSQITWNLKNGWWQVLIWRRSFDVPPPPLEESNEFYKVITEDPRYANEPSKEEFPMNESLKLTIERTLPYWNNVIVPQLKEGKKILIAAHGNSLRGIVKHLDGKISCVFKFILKKSPAP